MSAPQGPDETFQHYHLHFRHPQSLVLHEAPRPRFWQRLTNSSPHLSVWLIGRAVLTEKAAILQGNSRKGKLLITMTLNQSSMSLFSFTVLSLHFHSSSGSISLSGSKNAKELPVLEAIRLHVMCLPPSPIAMGGEAEDTMLHLS